MTISKPLSRYVLSIAASCAFLPFITAANGPMHMQVPGEQTVAAFDQAVATGLPRTLELNRDGKGTDRLVIEQKVDVDVTLPDDSKLLVFTGSLNGKPVVISRTGDRLDLSRPGSDGAEVSTFIRDRAATIRSLRGARPPSGVRDDAVVPGGAAMPPKAARGTPLKFWVFIHDDVGVPAPLIHSDYFAWWIADLKKNVLPGVEISLKYISKLRGYTDMRYGTGVSLALWTSKVEDFAAASNGTLTDRTKFLLLTESSPVSGLLGIAWEKGYAAMASDDSYKTAAHEFGHTLSATHEDAELRFNGWVCETNMYNPSVFLIASCYVYTARNEQHIRDYLGE